MGFLLGSVRSTAIWNWFWIGMIILYSWVYIHRMEKCPTILCNDISRPVRRLGQHPAFGFAAIL
ncbi:hypothetical protein VE23_24380 [Paenibacillus sp. D9]|nr:hypothetical protein VE23_24380 [Paenibacillus sp. D9]